MSETATFIDWGPQLVTGIASIDEQHKVMVDMCNEAYKLTQMHASAEVAKKLLRDLMSYALYHFEAEEEIAIQSGFDADYADRNAMHRAQHRAFAKTVADMQIELLRGNGISMEKLFEFLRAWLTEHILGTDMQLAAYIHQKA